eukprot:ANDGO_00119.mRNA.1 Charged multivesicular body protein 3
MGLFAKQPSPEERIREMRTVLRAEQRKVDREIREMKREETKLLRSAKEAARKSGDQMTVRMYAKNVAKCRSNQARMHTVKAQIGSADLSLQQTLSQAKIVGTVQKSSQILQVMHNLVKVPQISQVMRNVAQEFEKAGIMEEMIADSMDDAMGSGIDEDEELEDKVAEVLDEILNGKQPTRVTKTKITGASKSASKSAEKDEEDQDEEEEDEEEDEDEEDEENEEKTNEVDSSLRSRLSALQS